MAYPHEWPQERQECVCVCGIILVSFLGAVLGIGYVAQAVP